MKDLIANIDQFLLDQQHGWCEPIKAHTLASLIVALRPSVSVEIGVYAGRSTISMALAHQYIKYGHLVGIDPYTKEAATEGYTGEHLEWWKKIDMEWVMQMFLNRVKHYQLENYVTLARMKSDDVLVPPVIDLLHIDGNHSDRALNDVNRFAINVRLGGVCVADDENWPGGGVTKAVKRLLELGFIRLYPLDGGAVFQRISHGG